MGKFKYWRCARKGCGALNAPFRVKCIDCKKPKLSVAK